MVFLAYLHVLLNIDFRGLEGIDIKDLDSL